MSKRRELQAVWLEIWRRAGSPQLDTDTWNTPDAPLNARVMYWSLDNLGYKHYINIQLGDQDVTRLFSILSGYKGRGCMLYRDDFAKRRDDETIMRRSDYDDTSVTVQCVISQVIELHAAAAKAHLDVAAYRATGLPADELEARLLARATKRSRRQPPPKAL